MIKQTPERWKVEEPIGTFNIRIAIMNRHQQLQQFRLRQPVLGARDVRGQSATSL